MEFPNGSYRTTKPEGCLEDPEAAIAVSSKLLLENTAFMTPEQDDERALSWDAVTGGYFLYLQCIKNAKLNRNGFNVR